MRESSQRSAKLQSVVVETEPAERANAAEAAPVESPARGLQVESVAHTGIGTMATAESPLGPKGLAPSSARRQGPQPLGSTPLSPQRFGVITGEQPPPGQAQPPGDYSTRANISASAHHRQHSQSVSAEESSHVSLAPKHHDSPPEESAYPTGIRGWNISCSHSRTSSKHAADALHRSRGPALKRGSVYRASATPGAQTLKQTP